MTLNSETAAEAAGLVDRVIFRPGPMSRIAVEIVGKTGVTLEQMRSPRRWRSWMLARQELMWTLCHRLPAKSLPEIGRFVHRDHSTVIHGRRKHAERLVKQARIDRGED